MKDSARTCKIWSWAAIFSLAAMSMNAATASTESRIGTSAGIFTVEGPLIMLNGQQLPQHYSTDASFASLKAKYEHRDRTDVLAQFVYGTACPARFQWISVKKDQIDISPMFGSCSDLVESWETQGVSMVRIPGFGTQPGPFHFSYDGKRLKTIAFDGSGMQISESDELSEQAAALAQPTAVTAGKVPSSTRSATRTRVFPTVREGGILVDLPKQFDVAPIIMASTMKGCGSMFSVSTQVHTRSFGALTMQEYVLDAGCLPIAEGHEVEGIGYISDSDTISLSFMYVKGTRNVLMEYLTQQ